ncbi:IclR family transcriptional regulator [Roseovarius faecimaris]|uniref:IclR family transcriptional regulator n=1 Tax=Roseovarius faecimaris TaxID=2494550 RepID=A0A6I6IMC7_9RHOB|nr:IclR family transcriptional regulator [Roseovarius faecimaris]
MDTAPAKRTRGRPRKHHTDADTGTVQALDRGLHLLSLLSREHRITLSNLAMQAGMPPSTAHRLLMTLQSQKFADFDETTQEWMIGVEAFRIGSGFLRRINLVEASRDVMHNLMTRTGETANLAIADDGDVVFVSQVETYHPIRAFFRPGARSAMHASGAGKALLAQLSKEELERLLQKKGLPEFTPKTLTRPDALIADLEQSRKRGWAFDDEERYAGMRCIAAPVFNAYGAAVAGISVSGPTVRFDEERIQRFSLEVRRAAAELTEKIGGQISDHATATG